MKARQIKEKNKKRIGCGFYRIRFFGVIRKRDEQILNITHFVKYPVEYSLQWNEKSSDSMNKRYEKFDLLRGFAIIGVVLIHITAPLATDGDIFSIVINQMARFAVPVFFFLSGWGLTRAETFERSEGYWHFLKARFKSVFPQYAVWSLIYLVYSGVGGIQNFSELLTAFLMGTIYNHLYFVPIILVLYVFYPLLLKIANRFGVLLSLLITIVSQLSDIWLIHEYFYMNRNILNWIFYFVFGIWFSKNFEEKIEQLKKYKLPIWVGLALSMTLVILTPFLIGDIFDFNLVIASTRPTVIYYSTMVVLSAVVTDFSWETCRKMLLKTSQYSFYIYLNHYLFVSLWRRIYSDLNLEWHSTVYIVLTLGIILSASLITGFLTRKAEQKMGL